MKTPDEIKKVLRICSGKLLDYCDACNYCNWSSDCACNSRMCADALDYIQQLENHIGELTEKVAQLEEAQPKWFSVKEWLPENDDNYLVFTSDKNEAEIATYYGDGEWLTHDLTNLTRLVTHWAPLPSMPDPQKEKE